MEEQYTEPMGVDLSRFLDALIRKAWLIGLIAVLSAILAAISTFLFVTPVYESSAVFYVNNCSVSQTSSPASVSSGDIAASRSLVKTCMVILKTRETLDKVVDYAGTDLSYGQIKEMITAVSVENTEFFRVTVTGPDPAETKSLTEAIIHILPGRISDILGRTSVKTVDSPGIPKAPCFPDYEKNIAAGFLAGLMISVGYIIIQEWVDFLIRREEQITKSCGYPVLACIPITKDYAAGTIGDEMREGFDILSAKLQLLFEEKTDCRTIGVSSSLTGEGKSTVAVNLAHSMAQQGKRVLVIDCDMHRSALASALQIAESPGLSDYLMKYASGNQLLQRFEAQTDARAFHIITSGSQTLHPIELLSSQRMSKMLGQLRQMFDYIILDLPAVEEVGDALVVSRLLDGLMLVIRREYCNRIALKAAIREFELINTKIIGAVFNCTDRRMGQYGQWYGRKHRRK